MQGKNKSEKKAPVKQVPRVVTSSKYITADKKEAEKEMLKEKGGAAKK
jgi:hypothetical protein